MASCSSTLIVYGSGRGCTPCSRVHEHGKVSPLSNASYLGEPALAKCDLQCARFACALVGEVCGDSADICSCGTHTCAMLVHPAIPICPASRASQCVLSDLLLANGWETCGDALDVVISWLTDHELYTERDLVGLPDIASLSGAQQFSARALACLQQCVKVGALQIIARNTHAHTSWQVANVAGEKGVIPALKRPRTEERRASRLQSVFASRSRVSRPCITQRAIELVDAPLVLVDVRGAKPMEALSRLRATLPGDPAERRVWAQQARIAAVMGSCPKSHESFKSGATLHMWAHIALRPVWRQE